MATSPFAQFSLIVPDSDTGDAGHIRRNAFDATAQVTVRVAVRRAKVMEKRRPGLMLTAMSRTMTRMRRVGFQPLAPLVVPYLRCSP